MTVVRVTVESSLAGPSSGFQVITVDEKATVEEIIKLYCLAKEIPLNPHYNITNHANLLLQKHKSLDNYGVQNGEHLLLGLSSYNDNPYRFGYWFTLAGLGFLFGIVGITICVLLFAVFRTVPDNYAIVIDAGSTHSDVILYKWPGVKVNNTGEVVQVSTCYVTGGVAQITSSNVSTYFDTCMTSAKKQIPEESQANAEVLLGATAGMRLLSLSNLEKSQGIITSVREFLRTSTKMVVKDTNVEVISGSSEGISGWITINFLMDTIYSKVGYLNASWGALDLGGASTQITVEVSNGMKAHPLVNPLQLFGHKFQVFSKSFLCFGVVQAQFRYRAMLLSDHWKSNSNSLEVESPCDAKGRTIIFTNSEFQTPCLNSIPYIDRIEKSLENYTFLGTGDFAKCETLVNNLLDYETCRNSGLEQCLNSTLVPRFVGERKFMGFASFAYVANALRINKTTTKSDFLERTRHLCGSSYQTILEMKLADPSTFRDLENSCFKGQFVYNLLTKIYGFDTDEKFKNILFTTKIRSTTVGWSLGYMINATEQISAGNSVPTLHTVPFAFLTILFIMFLLVSIGFVYHGFKLRNSASYQRRIASQMDDQLTKFTCVKVNRNGGSRSNATVTPDSSNPTPTPQKPLLSSP